MGLFSFSCYQRFFVVVVVVVVEAELFYFPIETHTLEFNTPLVIIMYLIWTILLIQQLDKMVVMPEEKNNNNKKKKKM